VDSFPIYILKLGDETKVVFPEDRKDIGHTDFWEEKVAKIVVAYHKIPLKKLIDLPYCQRRARVVGTKVYYGERPDPVLLNAIRLALGDDRLVFAFDEHEKRLRDDVLEFRRLVRRARPKNPPSP
jgi:hypothetical protein